MFIRKIGISVTLALVTLMASMYRAEATDQDNLDCFHVSDEFKGKRYFMTKTDKSFKISDADIVCKFYGGYIAEFEDADEMEFVYDFVKRVDSGKLHYTGVINDETHQTHVYYHSGKRVPSELWGQGEPNDVGGNEDCAVITEEPNARGHRLNDVPCELKGKIVCESE